MARPGETEPGSGEPGGKPRFPLRCDQPDQPDHTDPPERQAPDLSRFPPPYPPSHTVPPAYTPPPPGPFPPPAYTPPPELLPAAPAPGQPPGGHRFFDRPGIPPANKRSAWFWLLMGLGGFVVGQVVGSIFVAVAAALAGESGQLSRISTMGKPPEWYIGTSLVGLWVGFLLGPWVASKARGTGRFFADMGVRFRLVDLAGIPIGVGSQIALDVLYAPFVKHLKHFTAPTQKLVGASHGWGYLAIAILTVCCAPFFEEILFRGLALRALTRLFAPPSLAPSRRRALAIAVAVAVDGVLFGLAHWELYQFAGLAAFGMVLAVLSYKTGRLGLNMVTHASFNLVAVLALVATSGVVR